MQTLLAENLAVSVRVEISLNRTAILRIAESEGRLLQIGPGYFDWGCMHEAELLVHISHHMADPVVIPAVLRQFRLVLTRCQV